MTTEAEQQAKPEEQQAVEAGAGASPEAPPAKKAKTEEGGAAPAEAAAEGAAPMEEAEEEGGEAAAAAAAEEKADGPVTLGYKRLENGKAAFEYFHHLLHHVTKNQDLNEYEHKAVLDLLTQGHPTPDSKVGKGVRAFQVRAWSVDQKVRCFYVMRVDGTMEDFSFRKCLTTMFPGLEIPNSKDLLADGGRGGRGGGRGRGRGRGRR